MIHKTRFTIAKYEKSQEKICVLFKGDRLNQLTNKTQAKVIVTLTDEVS
jgi:hypothetical protein